ncbi:Sad1-interacting factor 2 [Pseudovirgaria hyperparasitica]|uniref:Sad1-interacting factor 2 n=1 Tax=Pseudovirgaria hyperparasitica TaxID=470096 RepID=A0A6A6WMA0_9PEZI|nr:Sad1-interacting factor 2 [Pseudovirgaria hyperparasitica]KAF2763340.1 Sad1-interacting factor 2 [Pseudovirgaria hyperparasitica]
MASATAESTPLLHSDSQAQKSSQRTAAPKPFTRPQRNVTFNPTVLASSPPTSSAVRPSTIHPLPPVTAHHGGKQPVLSALNSKLRRRNSTAGTLPSIPAPKIGPQRTTRTAQKLKLLPDPEQGEDGDEESGRDVYAQFTRLKDPTSRRDAARLGKEDREKLPRVTAYCTASSYRMEDLMRFLKGKARLRGAVPKLFDECIYSPYTYDKHGMDKFTEPGPEHHLMSIQERERRYSDSAIEVETHNEQRRDDLINLHGQSSEEPSSHAGESSSVQDVIPDYQSLPESRPNPADFDTNVHIPEVFLFNYGTVVIWGMSMHQEHRFLKEISKFEIEKLAKDDVQTEDFNFYYTREYQARIYNDFISLREKKNYMTKLAISHALAQSTSLYEDLVDNTIESTKDIPAQIAMSGKVDLTRKQINMQIGELFILRISIHLQGSVLDAPELMWAEPQLDPVYQAVRSYLEMDQRVGLLTERLDVIADLLAVLKDQLTATHGELLEWIVIVLIAAEILVAAVNIVVDLYAGVD